MWEPNDTFVQACPISLKTEVTSSLASGDGDDYYAFPVEAGVVYTLNVWDTATVAGNLYASVLFTGATGPMTGVVAETGVGVNSIYSVDIPAQTQAGTFFVHLRYWNAAVTYKLSVVSGKDPGFDSTTLEPNNTPNTSVPLTSSTTVESQLSAPFDVADYYSLPVTKDHWYAFTMALQPAGGNVYLSATLAPAVGNTVNLLPNAGYGAGSTAFGEFQAVATGTARFAVGYWNAAVLYDFTLYPSTDDGLAHAAASNYEPNNTPHTAAPIQLAADITSTINVTDDSVDYFEVAVESGSQYVLTISDTAGAGGANLYISAGIYLPGATSPISTVPQNGVGAGAVKTFPFTASATGKLVALVQGWNGVAPYKLSVTKP